MAEAMGAMTVSSDATSEPGTDGRTGPIVRTGPGATRVRADAPGARWPLERTHERDEIVAAALAMLARWMRETGRRRLDGTLADLAPGDDELRVYRNVATGRFAVVLTPRAR